MPFIFGFMRFLRFMNPFGASGVSCDPTTRKLRLEMERSNRLFGWINSGSDALARCWDDY